MTTGRINQVTDFPHRPPFFQGGPAVHRYSTSSRTAFPDGSSSFSSFSLGHHTIPPTVPSLDVLAFRSFLSLLVPRSHTSQGHRSSGPCWTRITPFDGDYQRSASPARQARPRRIPEWLIASGLTHRQVIHTSLHHRPMPTNEHRRTY